MAEISVLKGKIPDDLYNQIDTILKDDKSKLADLSTGAYVGKEKFEAVEASKKAVETQMAEANKQIEAFKGMNIDEIKANADKWKTDFEAATTKHQQELAGLKLSYALDGKLTGEKAKNLTAVKALLKMDNIKLDGENLIGFDDQFKAIKEANPYLFDDGKEPPKAILGGSGQTTPATLTGVEAHFAKINPNIKI